jgi:ubiquinone/menaquinone biosynthesis C-methylase UbiE
MVDSKGSLERVTIEGNTLEIAGWAATSGAGIVDGFVVTCAGTELAIEALETGLPSPDLRLHNPRHDASDRCRFRIRARLDRKAKARAESSVITCTPLVSGEEGQILVHLIEPAIPAPCPEEAAAVGGNFLEVSTAFLGHMIQLAGLRRDSHVLDVGCGIGRIAYMLAHYLDPAARYEGFDLVEGMIAWPRRWITRRFPNFQFRKFDVYNGRYHPGGALEASEFRFPYEAECFDLVLLISVFTHMRAHGICNYLDEVRRVLRPGGRCLATCFLLNEESRLLIGAGKSSLNLVHPLAGGFTIDRKVPERAIGFEEAQVLGWIADRGFTLRTRNYGSWCGRRRFLSYQDLLVYQKPQAAA